MLDEKLKQYKNQFLQKVIPPPLTQVNPSYYSLLGIIFFIPSFYLIINSSFTSALGLFAISRFFDGLDGYVAMIQNKTSKTGEIIDQFLDLIIYGTFIIAIVLENSSRHVTILGLFILLIYYVNIYINSTYFNIIKSDAISMNTEDKGDAHLPLVEGTETLAFYTLFLIFNPFIGELMISFTALLVIGLFRQVYFLLRIAN